VAADSQSIRKFNEKEELPSFNRANTDESAVTVGAAPTIDNTDTVMS
jgi:hypothetical protein